MTTKRELRRQVREYQADAEQYKADYLGACKLVADMHAAAVGEVRGPNRGVVEDVQDRIERAEMADQIIAGGLVAFQLTREYVGEGLLPEIAGWSWFDWCSRAERWLAADAART